MPPIDLGGGYTGTILRDADRTLQITNSANEVVYKTEVNVDVPGTYTYTTTLPEDLRIALVVKYNELSGEILTTCTTHYRNMFVDLLADYEVPLMYRKFQQYKWEHRPPQTLDPCRPSDVFEKYIHGRYGIHVVTGSFSKSFIDIARNILGKSNVLVINIVRNPSAAYSIHYQHEGYYTGDYTYDKDKEKILESVINSAILSRCKYVKTIRFEDIIKNGSFDVNGITVKAPSGYDHYNNYLTQWEKTHYDQQHISPVDMDSWNYTLQHIRDICIAEATNSYMFDEHFTQWVSDNNVDVSSIDVIPDNYLDYVQQMLEIPESEFAYIADGFKGVPQDMFAQLKYEPLTREQVIESPVNELPLGDTPAEFAGDTTDE
jgi:hypothetical protein